MVIALAAACGPQPIVAEPGPPPPEPGVVEPSGSGVSGPGVPVTPGQTDGAVTPDAPPDGATHPGPPAPTTPPATTCAGPKPSPDAVCMQACGPPVSRVGDPPPGFIWMTPAQVQNRKQFGCPICLPGDARIATPAGEVRVRDLAPGMPVYTQDRAGRRVVGRVEAVGSAAAPPAHELARVELADGRALRASPGHPTADGRALGALRAGERLDGAAIARVARVPYGGERTYDLLPSGETGAYWADGVLVGSTLVATP